MKSTLPLWLALLAASAAGATPPQGTTPAALSAPAGGPAYARLAALADAAPIVLDARIRRATRIPAAEAPGLEAGHVRLYVEADVAAALRAPAALLPRLGYLLDVPADARGRPPSLKKLRVLLFARPVAGSATTIQLVRPDAQLAWSPPLDARVRTILRDLVASDAPPAITGVGNAFYVPGALPGEGETQVFLTTADQRPVSLSILSRPGETKRWAVALSEIVDDAARPPAPETLLWYRLACGLPPALPATATSGLDANAAEQARADYAFVVASLGPCGVD